MRDGLLTPRGCCCCPQDLEKTLEPLLFYYKAARRADEGFGDFCGRVGFPALEAYAASYISPTASESLPQVRIARLPSAGSQRCLA